MPEIRLLIFDGLISGGKLFYPLIDGGREVDAAIDVGMQSFMEP